MHHAKLQAFRETAYRYLCKAHDAMFELADAVLVTRHAYCFAELSQSSVFRRRWPSTYEALQDSRPQRQKLMRLYLDQIPAKERPVLAGDHTIWPRPYCPTLQERTIEHQTTPISGNRPIGIGQGWSTLAWVPQVAGTWALPLRHERITSWETAITKAVWQLRQVCRYLAQRPISLWDSEYGCASFVLKSADIAADKLMRVRSNRCLWNAPPPYSGKGRPRVHGDKFKLNDPATWSLPTQAIEFDDSKLGRLRIRCWKELHFRQAPQLPFQLILVERLDTASNEPIAKPWWLAWVGESMPPLSQIWLLYRRRFGVDHWYRFAKQRLHWTLPHLGTPQQTERWSELMPLLTWQLWLAREIVVEHRLPWQKPQAHLSPGRVAQSMATVLAEIGTPAQPPKPRGKSPGWPSGQARQPRIRYPIVKKRVSRRQNRLKKSA